MSALCMWCQWSLRGGAWRDRLERIGAVLLEPPIHVVVVELLAPHHARERLAHDVLLVGVERRRDDRRVELVGFAFAAAMAASKAWPNAAALVAAA